jgi:hypothetical protein
MEWEPDMQRLVRRCNRELAEIMTRLWTAKREALAASPPLYIG